MCCKSQTIIIKPAKQGPQKVIVPAIKKQQPVKKLNLVSNDKEKYRV